MADTAPLRKTIARYFDQNLIGNWLPVILDKGPIGRPTRAQFGRASLATLRRRGVGIAFPQTDLGALALVGKGRDEGSDDLYATAAGMREASNRASARTCAACFGCRDTWLNEGASSLLRRCLIDSWTPT